MRYDDYQLTRDRKQILRKLVFQTNYQLRNRISGATHFFNRSQSDSPTWKQMRKILITAPVFKSFMTKENGEQITNFVNRRLWLNTDFDNAALQCGRKKRGNSSENIRRYF